MVFYGFNPLSYTLYIVRYIVQLSALTSYLNSPEIWIPFSYKRFPIFKTVFQVRRTLANYSLLIRLLFSFDSVIFYEGNNICFAFETNFNACFKFARGTFNIDYSLALLPLPLRIVRKCSSHLKNRFENRKALVEECHPYFRRI